MPPPFSRPYLDSSVYISIIKGEENRAETCLQIVDLARLEEFPIFASTFLYTEVIKDRGQPPLTPEQESAIDTFFSQQLVTWVELDLLVAKKARSLSRQHGLKPADAVHLATAIRAGCDQLLAWDTDFPSAEVEGVLCVEPHLTGRNIEITGFSELGVESGTHPPDPPPPA